MYTLGINISHNPSISLVSNGEVISFYDETRFKKQKHFDPLNITRYGLDPSLIYYHSLDKKLNNIEIDKVIIASSIAKGANIRKEYNEQKLKFEDMIFEDYTHIDYETIQHLYDNQLKKRIPNLKEIIFLNEHHLYHALNGFYFSKFDEAICVVMDGGGAQPLDEYPGFSEIESIYYINKNNIISMYKHLSCFPVRLWLSLYPGFGKRKNLTIYRNNCEYFLSNNFSDATLFAQLTRHIGLCPSNNPDEDGYNSGKTMGLAAYGNKKGFDHKDLAKKLQIKSEKNTIALLKKAMNFNNSKNIVLSGGYALNCLNNYKYVKKFPEYNFFVDPCAHDGGTASGAALFVDKYLNDYIR